MAACATKTCLEATAHLGLTGPASRCFGTTLRTAAVRNAMQHGMIRDTPLEKVLGWIVAAADAHRHLTNAVFAEAVDEFSHLMQLSKLPIPPPPPVDNASAKSSGYCFSDLSYSLAGEEAASTNEELGPDALDVWYAAPPEMGIDGDLVFEDAPFSAHGLCRTGKHLAS